MPRTIGIIGAGPVGGILAAHLSSAGHAVILADAWKEHIERIHTDWSAYHGPRGDVGAAGASFDLDRGLGRLRPGICFHLY